MNLELQKEKNFQQWMNQPISEISHHGFQCCEEVREWIVSTYSAKARNGANSGWVSSLLALIEDFEWGPNQWPIHWCEILKAETIDCGVFSALAKNILSHSGIKAYPAQIIHRKTEDSVPHIRQAWGKTASSDFFAGSSYSYHELCMIEAPGALSPILFDTSYGIRFGHFDRSDIYDAVAGIRVIAPKSVKWHNLNLKDNSWYFLGS